MIPLTSQQTKHLSERDVSKIQDGHRNWLCTNSKYSRNNTFLKTLFRKIIWNRRIITLVVWVIKLHEKIQDKNVLLNFKIFEKIKQVSSTKLTNWYKIISRWKQTNPFTDLFFFLGANLKVSKILLQSLRASFRNTKNYLSEKS